MRKLTWTDVRRMAKPIVRKIADKIRDGDISTNRFGMVCLYGIPRGGVYAAQAVQSEFYKKQAKRIEYVYGVELTDDPSKATVFIDDIIDSGITEKNYSKKYPDIPFFPLVRKNDDTPWLEFPWERQNNEQGPEDNVVRMLEHIGEDPTREGLVETPKRVVRSYDELFKGYDQDPKDVIKVFEDGACDNMVVLRDIEFFSHCEHHILPFTGKAYIGYLPDGKVIGVSKLVRLLEIYSRRLQIQERIGQQVTEVLMEELEPLGCGCVLKAQHLCMRLRGVEKQHSEMVTSSLRGNFREENVKQEFLKVIE